MSGVSIRMRSDGTADGLPPLVERLRRVARDPTASAEFFNAFCTAFLNNLLSSNRDPVNIRTGILGNVSGHYGVVEEQNRGSLHLHVLIWLHGAPQPDELFRKLESDPGFKRRFLEYYDDCIKESLPPGASIAGRDDRGRERAELPREVEPPRPNPYRSPSRSSTSARTSGNALSIHPADSEPQSWTNGEEYDNDENVVMEPDRCESKSPMTASSHQRQAERSSASIVASGLDDDGQDDHRTRARDSHPCDNSVHHAGEAARIVDLVSGCASSGGLLPNADDDESNDDHVPVDNVDGQRDRSTHEHPSCRFGPSGSLRRSKFQTAMERDLCELIPRCQTHRHSDTCKKYGYTYCRFGFPREIVTRSLVVDGKRLEHERHCAWVNNWNPYIAMTGRCNHDIKWIGTGYDAKSLIMYTTLTNYVTKIDLSSDAAQRMLTDWCDCLDKLGPPKPGSNLDRARTLMLKLSNKMALRTDHAGPLLCTYLIGKPDHYASHQYAPLLINSFLTWARAKEPQLKTVPTSLPSQQQSTTDSDQSTTISEPSGTAASDRVPGPAPRSQCGNYDGSDLLDNDGLVEVLEDYEIFQNVSGELSLSSQRIDYMCRGSELADLSLYQWVEQFIKRGPTLSYSVNPELLSESSSVSSSSSSIQSNSEECRFPFDERHPQFRTHNQQMRSKHRVIPNLIGPPLPSRTKQPEDHALQALLLFKPFTELVGDSPLALRRRSQTWAEAWAAFLSSSSAFTETTSARRIYGAMSILQQGREHQVAERQRSLRGQIRRAKRMTEEHLDDTIADRTSDPLSLDAVQCDKEVIIIAMAGVAIPTAHRFLLLDTYVADSRAVMTQQKMPSEWRD
jgi:hypothetical protein